MTVDLFLFDLIEHLKVKRDLEKNQAHNFNFDKGSWNYILHCNIICTCMCIHKYM